MTRRNLIVLVPLFLLCFSSAAVAQNRLGHLKSWAGKYPSEKKGRVTTKFFGLSEIRTPLLRLLSRSDFDLLTREYAVEAPIKLIGDYLVVKVCRPHNCADDQAGLAINLQTGVIFVRMQAKEIQWWIRRGRKDPPPLELPPVKVSWFVSKGNATDLPQEIQEYMGDFAAQ